MLLVDGKYIKVNTCPRKIPVFYGIDYLTHDIPHFLLSRAENYTTCKKFFTSLNLTGYPLRGVIADDNLNIFEASRHIYPKVGFQLCHVHYARNIRLSLDLDKHPEYIPFFMAVKELLFTKRSLEDFNKRATTVLKAFQTDPICVNILFEVERRKSQLLGYLHCKGIPLTTNLIECFNSHLNARVTKLKGFETMEHANLWLNGYFLRRRTKKSQTVQENSNILTENPLLNL